MTKTINAILYIGGDLTDKILEDCTIKVKNLLTFNYSETGGHILTRNPKGISWKDLALSSESYNEIVNGYYPDRTSCIVDVKTIDLMAKHEDTIYRMITRSTYYSSNLYFIRKVYLNHLRFWSNYISKNKINLYVGHLAHNVATYIPYCLCKELGIKTVIIKPFSLGNYNFSYISDENNTDRTIVKEIIEHGGKSFVIDKLKNNKEIFEDVYNSNVLGIGDSTPNCIKKNVQSKYFFKSRIKGLQKNITAKRFLPILLKGKELIKASLEYFFNELYLMRKYYEPKPEDSFILYAMHYQPEATTLPLGGPYVDQALAIEAISNVLPHNVLLYVKEHPNQKYGYGRGSGFYKEILKNNGVRIIKKNIPSSSLVDKSIAVASVTGTILFESSCKKKPSIMFGSGLYEAAPGVHKVYTLDSLAIALDKIINTKLNISDENLRAYFYQLSEMLIMEEDIGKQYEEIKKHIIEL